MANMIPLIARGLIDSNLRQGIFINPDEVTVVERSKGGTLIYLKSGSYYYVESSLEDTIDMIRDPEKFGPYSKERREALIVDTSND